ncbi:hypothetical protein GCM10027589_35680 [Actinocorallia lasiicapitis]
MTREPESIAVRWRKSSYSAQGGADCVEVAGSSGRVLVRDSKNPAVGMLALRRTAFAALAEAVR